MSQDRKAPAKPLGRAPEPPKTAPPPIPPPTGISATEAKEVITGSSGKKTTNGVNTSSDEELSDEELGELARGEAFKEKKPPEQKSKEEKTRLSLTDMCRVYGLDEREFKTTVRSFNDFNEKSKAKLEEERKVVLSIVPSKDTSLEPEDETLIANAIKKYLAPYKLYAKEGRTLEKKLNSFTKELEDNYKETYEPLNNLRKDYVTFLKQYAEERFEKLKIMITEGALKDDQIEKEIQNYNNQFLGIQKINHPPKGTVKQALILNTSLVESTLDPNLSTSSDLEKTLSVLNNLLYQLYQRKPPSPTLERTLKLSFRGFAGKHPLLLTLQEADQRINFSASVADKLSNYKIKTPKYFADSLKEIRDEFSEISADRSTFELSGTNSLNNFKNSVQRIETDKAKRKKEEEEREKKKQEEEAKRKEEEAKREAQRRKEEAEREEKRQQEEQRKREEAQKAQAEKIRLENIAYRGIIQTLKQVSGMEPNVSTSVKKIEQLSKVQEFLSSPPVSTPPERKRSASDSADEKISSTASTQQLLAENTAARQTLVELPPETKQAILGELRQLKELADSHISKLKELKSSAPTTITLDNLSSIPNSAQRTYAAIHLAFKDIDLTTADPKIIQERLASYTKPIIVDPKKAVEDMLGITALRSTKKWTEEREAKWNKQYEKWAESKKEYKDHGENQRKLNEIHATYLKVKENLESKFSPDEIKKTTNFNSDEINTRSRAMRDQNTAWLAIPPHRTVQELHDAYLGQNIAKNQIAELLSQLADQAHQLMLEKKQHLDQTQRDKFNRLFFEIASIDEKGNYSEESFAKEQNIPILVNKLNSIVSNYADQVGILISKANEQYTLLKQKGALMDTKAVADRFNNAFSGIATIDNYSGKLTIYTREKIEEGIKTGAVKTLGIDNTQFITETITSNPTLSSHLSVKKTKDGLLDIHQTTKSKQLSREIESLKFLGNIDPNTDYENESKQFQNDVEALLTDGKDLSFDIYKLLKNNSTYFAEMFGLKTTYTDLLKVFEGASTKQPQNPSGVYISVSIDNLPSVRLKEIENIIKSKLKEEKADVFITRLGKEAIDFDKLQQHNKNHYRIYGVILNAINRFFDEDPEKRKLANNTLMIGIRAINKKNTTVNTNPEHEPDTYLRMKL